MPAKLSAPYEAQLRGAPATFKRRISLGPNSSDYGKLYCYTAPGASEFTAAAVTNGSAVK
jgi:hypothetical protein